MTMVFLQYYNTQGVAIAISVRLDPVIEARLTQQAELLGITKSDFIKDASKRVLGMKCQQCDTMRIEFKIDKFYG